MRVKKKTGRIRLPRQAAGYNELADFFDRHDGTDLLDQGITEIDPDRADLDRMLREYWRQAKHEAVEYPHPAGGQAHDRATGETQDG